MFSLRLRGFSAGCVSASLNGCLSPCKKLSTLAGSQSRGRTDKTLMPGWLKSLNFHCELSQ